MNGEETKRHYIPKVAVKLVREGSIITAEPKVIRQPANTVPILAKLFEGLVVEQFAAILLNTKNHVLAVSIISSGSINSSIVRPAELFRIALLHGATATSIILAHNHPSGDPSPSQEDISLTKRLVEAGKLLDIIILDHIIYSDNAYVSFKEKGII